MLSKEQLLPQQFINPELQLLQLKEPLTRQDKLALLIRPQDHLNFIKVEAIKDQLINLGHPLQEPINLELQETWEHQELEVHPTNQPHINPIKEATTIKAAAIVADQVEAELVNPKDQPQAQAPNNKDLLKDPPKETPTAMVEIEDDLVN